MINNLDIRKSKDRILPGRIRISSLEEFYWMKQWILLEFTVLNILNLRLLIMVILKAPLSNLQHMKKQKKLYQVQKQY